MAAADPDLNEAGPGRGARNLAPLFRPRALAVIGASDDPARIRGRILAQIVKSGYPGRIYPIHPTLAQVQGIPARTAIGQVPETVDLALIAIPAEKVPEALAQCAASGVRGAVIFSSGFAEEGLENRALQERVGAIARDAGMAVLGPNLVGFLNVDLPLAATFSPAIDFAALPGLRAGRGRRIGIISQSGGLGFALFNRGLKRGLGFSHVVNTGNEADLDACDIIEFLLKDDATGIVLMIIEAIRRGRRFMALAERALALGKPIIVAKIGRSAAGRRAAASHTASLVGSDAAYDATFRRYGVIRADDQDDMLDIAAAAALCPAPRGRRIGIVTISGGVGGWMADTLEAQGLAVPEFSPELQARIRRFLPSYGMAFNPVDITAGSLENDHRLQSVRALDEAEEVDATVVVNTLAGDPRLPLEKAELAAIAARRAKPLLFYSYTLPSAASLADLAEIGVPSYTSLRGVALALKALAERGEAAAAPPVAVPPPPGARQAALAVLDGAEHVLTEHQSKAVLRAYGIVTPPEHLATSRDGAVAAAAAIAAPVALKIQSPDLPHKSDVGGVRLGLGDTDAVAAAYDELLARVAAAAPAARIAGVLVQPMARPGLELILGMRNDDDFGPQIAVGLGGVQVEVLADVAAAPAPLDVAAAERLLGRLRGAALLGAWRGAAPRDRAALAALLERLSGLALDLADRIAEIDLNPVLLHAEGGGLTIVDALIVQARPPVPSEAP